MNYLVQDFFTEWLELNIRNTVKARTYTTYSETVRLHILPAFGGLYINNLTAKDVRKLIAEKLTSGNLKTGGALSCASVELIRIVLSLAFGFAVENGIIGFSPMEKIKTPRKVGRKAEAFTRNEQRKIEEYISLKPKPEYIGILLSLYTGLRLGEILALEYGDIDFRTGFLHITKTAHYAKTDGKYAFVTDTPKSDTSRRIIPIPKNLTLLLKEAKRNSKSKYIIARQNGKRIPTHSYQYAFQALLRKCKLAPRPFHSLRHTFATRALEVGFDVKTLSEIMGHSNVAFTLKRYTHSQAEYKIKTMHKLDALFFAIQSKSPNDTLCIRGSPI